MTTRFELLLVFSDLFLKALYFTDSLVGLATALILIAEIAVLFTIYKILFLSWNYLSSDSLSTDYKLSNKNARKSDWSTMTKI